MSQLVPQDAAPSPRRQSDATPASTGQSTARVLQAAHLLEEPWRLREQLQAEFPTWYRGLYGDLPTVDALRHPERSDIARRAAEEILDNLPPRELAARLITAIAKLDDTVPDRRQTLALIAAMVAGFPNGRPPDPEAYIQGLLHEVMVAEHLPAVVARATRELARSSKFLPNISEVLEACTEAAAIKALFDRLLEAQDRRLRIEDAMAEADRLGPRNLDAEWRDAVGLFAKSGDWKDSQGPKPGDHFCRAPAHILAEFGFGPPTATEWRDHIRRFKEESGWPARLGPQPGRRGCPAPRELLEEAGIDQPIEF